jgi:hypothetical protein
MILFIEIACNTEPNVIVTAVSRRMLSEDRLMRLDMDCPSSAACRANAVP